MTVTMVLARRRLCGEWLWIDLIGGAIKEWRLIDGRLILLSTPCLVGARISAPSL